MAGAGRPKTGGRKAGVKNKRSLTAAETFNGQNFDALETLIKLTKKAISDHDYDLAGRHCTTLARYQYPQLKQLDVDVHTPSVVTVRTFRDFYSDPAVIQPSTDSLDDSNDRNSPED